MKTLVYLSLQSLNAGTAPAVHVREIIRNLEQIGWRVDLFAPDYSGRSRVNLLIKICAQAIVQMKAILGVARSGVVYIRSHPNAFPLLIAGRMLGKTVVLEVNGPHEDIVIHHPYLRPVAPVLRWLQKRQFKLASGIVCVTAQLRDWIIEQVRYDNVVLVENAANSEIFRPGRPLDIKINKPYVVFVGTLRRWHGVDWILESLEHPEWPEGLGLVIVGDGPDAYKVNRAVDAGLANLAWLQRLSYENVADVVANAKVSLIAIIDIDGRSKTGLAPLKLYESMSSGVPVIVSDLPFQSDIVRQNNTGIVVAPGNVEELVNAVNTIMHNPAMAEEMGRCGREFIEQGNTWHDRALKIDQFLVSLAGR